MNRKMYVYKSVAESRVTNVHHIIHSALTGSRSPAGPRRLGTATRISASLSRRLSASFWRTPGQDPKAAKFAVLIPGHAGFPNRVKRSEGRDSTPSKTPLFRRVSRLCEKLKNAMKNGLGRSCSGNFLTIFVGTVLSEKPNFLSRIFGQ